MNAIKRRRNLKIDHTYYFYDLAIECELEYYTGCKGSWEDGQQIEPDDPPSMTLLSARIGSTDIYEMLTQHYIDDIEENAIQNYEGEL
jgi:hypothetical protein